MRKYLALVVVGLLALGLVATFGLAKGPAEKNDHNCMGYFTGGFAPGVVGAFVPGAAPVNDIATNGVNANCGATPNESGGPPDGE